MEQRNSYWEIVITAQAGQEEPHWHDSLMHSSSENPKAGLLDTFRSWQAATAMKQLELTHIADERYSLLLIHEDERRWEQELRLGEKFLDTQMNFNVSDFWSLEELRGGRSAVLESIVNLLLVHKIASITVEWF